MLLGICYLMSLAATVCWILVLIKMFQHGETTWAIASIVLVFCVGIGQIVAFVFGWSKAREWNMQKLMVAWSVFLAIGVLFGGVHTMWNISLP
ncbi:MAG: hypothetical protein K2Y37_03555 [Pirellulales bacterium]|nr:hypothetical protein [Pirellulales bacterium]